MTELDPHLLALGLDLEDEDEDFAVIGIALGVLIGAVVWTIGFAVALWWLG